MCSPIRSRVLGAEIKQLRIKHRKKGNTVSLFHFLCWNTGLVHLKRKWAAKLENFSSFSNDQTSKSLSAQVPNVTVPPGVSPGRDPNFQLELPSPLFTCFSYNGEGRGGRGDWKIFKQSQNLLKSCLWPGERRISRNNFRFISDS